MTPTFDWTHSLGAQISSEVLNFKFYATEFDNISFAKFIIRFRRWWFKVTDNNKHLVVYILILRHCGLLLPIHWYKSIVFDEELPILFMHNDQRLSLWAIFCSWGLSWNEFNIIVQADDLASCVWFDVSLCDLTGLVVK